MRNRYVLIALVLVALAFGVGRLSAAPGTLDSPDVPGNTQSFTLEDIYNRLDTGAAGVQSTFTEPAAGPGTGTMHDLNEIMAQAPAIDNTDGATETNVLDGKTFWGLTGGQWGAQTGNIPTQTVSNTTVSQLAGYYNAFDLSAVDTDLASGNIRSTVSIYGVAGDPNVVNTSSGDAAAGEILQGKKAWVDGAEVTGNIATQTVDNTTVNQAAGYYDAFNLSTEDPDLATGNIRSGFSIYGVAGDPMVVDTSSGDAVAGEILQGKKAWVDGAEVTGNIATQTVVSTTVNQAAGYYNAFDLSAVDTDLVFGNIKTGVDIFGVTGSYAGTTCSGDATTTDVLYPKTFSNSSSTGLTGELHGGCTCTGIITPTGGTRWCDNGDGTVTDLLGYNGKGKCLVWVQNARWGGLKPWEDCTGYYNDAHTRASSYGGYLDDWRLPTQAALYGLANGTEAVRSSSMRAFTGVQSNYYWSSTTNAGNTTDAWRVNLYYGYVNYGYKTSTYYVWPVRGGQ